MNLWISCAGGEGWWYPETRNLSYPEANRKSLQGLGTIKLLFRIDDYDQRELVIDTRVWGQGFRVLEF